MDRNEAITRIRQALKKRSGKSWSVKGDTGTAWGWFTISAPPKRRTWVHKQTTSPEPPVPGAVYLGAVGITPNYREVQSYEQDPWAREAYEKGNPVSFLWEFEDPSTEFGHMGPADRKNLAELLKLEKVHTDGISVPASSEYREEYVARAEGRTPTVYGSRYWD